MINQQKNGSNIHVTKKKRGLLLLVLLLLLLLLLFPVLPSYNAGLSHEIPEREPYHQPNDNQKNLFLPFFSRINPGSQGPLKQ